MKNFFTSVSILAILSISAQGIAHDKEDFWTGDLNPAKELAVMSLSMQAITGITLKSYVRLKEDFVKLMNSTIENTKVELKNAEDLVTSEAEKLQKIKDLDLEIEYLKYQKETAEKVNQKEIANKLKNRITQKNAEYIQAHSAQIVSSEMKAEKVTKLNELLKSRQEKLASIKMGHVKWVKLGANLALIDFAGRIVATLVSSTKDHALSYALIPGSSVVALFEGVGSSFQNK